MGSTAIEKLAADTPVVGRRGDSRQSASGPIEYIGLEPKALTRQGDPVIGPSTEQERHDKPHRDRRSVTIGRLRGIRLPALPSRTLVIALTAQLAQYGAGLALVPFMVTRLSPAEIGIWYIFVAVQGLAIIADFGFQPTLARAFAAAFAGAPALQKQGMMAADASQAANRQLVAEILHAARRLYLWLAVGLMILLVAAGTPAMSWLATRDGLPVGEIQIAWLVFASAVALTIYFLWISPLLIGSDRIQFNYIYMVLSRGSYAAVGIGVLLAGGGLVALSLALLASVLAARLAVSRFLSPVLETLQGLETCPTALRQTLRSLSPNAVRMGIVLLSGFLINRYSLFAFSAFHSLGESSAYGITLQLFSALSAASQIPMHISTSRFVALRIAVDKPSLRRLLVHSMLLLIAIFVVGAVTIIVGVPAALRFIGSNVSLIPFSALLLMAVVMLLESQHSGAAFVITTGNDVPFLAASVSCGLAVALLTTAVSWAGYGIFAVILCQGAVQLAYNNWYWPYRAWKDTSP